MEKINQKKLGNHIAKKIYIDNEPIYVLDNLLSENELSSIYEIIIKRTFIEKQSESGILHSILRSELSVLDMEEFELNELFINLLRKHFSEKNFVHYRSICNELHYGSYIPIHNDTPFSGTPVFTVLMYLNPFWESNWGSETIFFNSKGDAEGVVSIKSGRIVLFHGKLLHSANCPNKFCSIPKFTLNSRYLYEI